MGLMKTIHTAMHNNGPHAFDHLSKEARETIRQIIANRHKMPKKQEIIGEWVVIIGEMVKEPVDEGNYIILDITTGRQRIVNVHQSNQDWYVYEIGLGNPSKLDQFNQRYYRWLHIFPLSKEVTDELRRRKLTE